MRFSHCARQRGDALIVAIVAVLFFHVIAYVLLQWAHTVREDHFYASESVGLMQMQRALTQYALANQASFKAGDTIMYVSNQNTPTVTELQALGFLTSNGPEVTAPWGSTFATTLTLKPTGAVVGAVYLAGNIRDASGAPDPIHACRVAKALGSIGLCAPPGNPAVLGNLSLGTTPLANPTGSPAAVGALVSIPP
jgi:hypothetical protein